MKYVLFRSRLSITSGAGQLIKLQAHELKKQHHACRVYCEKKRFKFFLSTGLWARRTRLKSNILVLPDKNSFIIDHSGVVKNADVNFIHNVGKGRAQLTEENLANDLTDNAIADTQSHVIANSFLVKKVLRNEGVAAERISVVYPSYDKERFNVDKRDISREESRKKLGVAPDVKLIGYITSGNFKKRGLDLFLDICGQLPQSEYAFFLLGGDSIPDEYQSHELVRSGQLIHKPKCSHPEFWLSALDLFVYPARFEEFGMVIPEALAMGIPVVTSRLVGASEILLDDYQPFLMETPALTPFVETIKRLMNDQDCYQKLQQCGFESLRYTDQDYSQRTLSVIGSLRPLSESSMP